MRRPCHERRPGGTGPLARALPALLVVITVAAVGYRLIDHTPSLAKQRTAERAGIPTGHPSSPPLPHVGPGVPPPLMDPGLENAALVASTNPSRSPNPTNSHVDETGRTREEGTGVQARHLRARSPLESSPGYYPPADPESLAEIVGRRDAPEVNMEFTGGAPTLEAFARAAVECLRRKDEPALHALRVSRREYEEILWPEFPQSRPITHIPFDEVWSFVSAQSQAGAGHAAGEYGGRPLTLLRVEYGRLEPFRNFILYRDVRLVVRDSRTGRVETLAFAPSVAERRGRLKALTFKD